MKSRIIVVTEYSRGKTFEEAVANLFKNGLMNGNYSTVLKDTTFKMLEKKF